MDERRWEQIAAGTGVAFVVVLAIATFIVGQPPGVDDPAGQIRSYFVDNASGVRTQAWLYGVAGVLFIWFAGTLRAFLARAEGEGGRLSLISFAGAIGTLATLGPAIALNLAMIETAAGGGGGSTQVTNALFQLGFWFAVLAVFSIAVFAGAAGLSAGRTGALPQWWAWGGLAVAVLHLLQSFDVFLDSAFFEPTGFLGYLNFALVALWVLAGSVLLLQSLGGRARSRSR